MSVAFVTNFCPHYRVRTFEMIADRLDAEFFFFSPGREWYWPAGYGVRSGAFPHRYLRGFGFAGASITPSLPCHLARRRHTAVVKCVNGRFALPATYLTARARGLPFVLWTGVWHKLQSGPHRFLHPLTRSLYRRSDAVVTYGEHVRRFLVAEGVEPERIFVAPHATDAELYGRSVSDEELATLRHRLHLPAGRPVVLYLGRLERAKGVHLLLDAFLGGPIVDAVLLFVGSGIEKEALMRRTAEAGAGDRVRYAPAISPEEAPAYHAMASVLVLASITTPRFKEPWGLVVNEAFHQGTPVVTSDAVGAAAGGLVEDRVTGLVVPEGDPIALGRALRQVLLDDDLRRRLGGTARDRVADWSNERMVQGFADAVAAARRRRRRT